MSKKDWRLLEAYKATGLSPEQIIKMKEREDANRHKLLDSANRPELQSPRKDESCAS